MDKLMIIEKLTKDGLFDKVLSLELVVKTKADSIFWFKCGVNSLGYKPGTIIPIKIIYEIDYPHFSKNKVYKVKTFPFIIEKETFFSSKSELLTALTQGLLKMGFKNPEPKYKHPDKLSILDSLNTALFWEKSIDLTEEKSGETITFESAKKWIEDKSRLLFLKSLNEIEKKFFFKMFYNSIWIYNPLTKEDSAKTLKHEFEQTCDSHSYLYTTDIKEERRKELIEFALKEYRFIAVYSKIRSPLFKNLVEEIWDYFSHESKSKKYHPILDILKLEQERIKSITELTDYSKLKFKVMDSTQFNEKYVWSKNQEIPWYLIQYFYHYMNQKYYNENKKIAFLEYNWVFASVIAIQKFDKNSIENNKYNEYTITFATTHLLLQNKGFSKLLFENLYKWLKKEWEVAIAHTHFSDTGWKGLYPLTKELGEKYGLLNNYDSSQLENTLDEK